MIDPKLHQELKEVLEEDIKFLGQTFVENAMNVENKTEEFSFNDDESAYQGEILFIDLDDETPYSFPMCYTCEEDEIFSDDLDVYAEDIKAAAQTKKQKIEAATYVKAADGDFDEGFDDFDNSLDEMSDDEIGDQLDELADSIDDMQDDLDEITEDDENIEVENNIEGHFIAECERCKGIFISAIVESEQLIESIHGVCPLCNKESEQLLKWKVTAV